MMLVRSRRKPSDRHGLGIFAEEFIPEGAATWRFTPGFDQTFHPSEIQRVPEPVRDQFLTYAYLDTNTGLFVLCADDARFMNHAADPNTVPDYDADPIFGVYVAARDIEPGEELTCDYRVADGLHEDGLTFDASDN